MATYSSTLAWRIPWTEELQQTTWQATAHGVPKSQTWLSDFAYSPEHLEDLFLFLKMLFYIGAQFINNVVLVSGVHQDNSDIYIFISLYIYIYIHTHTYIYFFTLFSHLDYYRVLSRFPCAVQQVPVGYFKYSSVYMSVPNSQPVPTPHPSPLVTINSFSKSVSLSFL